MPATDKPPGRAGVIAVPLLTALIPLVAVHVCYGLGAYYGHYTWCVPYLPDCVSVSATGRHPPGSVIFRAAVIPTAVLMVIYWRLAYAWLAALGNPMPRLNRGMLWLGIAAGLGLFAYAIVLGEVGDHYRSQRRIGMIIFYGSAILAELSLSAQATDAQKRHRRLSATSARALIAIAAAAAVLGILALVSWAFVEDYRRFEDAFGWSVTALLLTHPLVVAVAWRETGFKARHMISGNGG